MNTFDYVRPADAAFHQIEQVRAGGQIGCARLRRGGNGLSNRRRSHIIERFHATFLRLAGARAFCASSTASVIP